MSEYHDFLKFLHSQPNSPVLVKYEMQYFGKVNNSFRSNIDRWQELQGQGRVCDRRAQLPVRMRQYPRLLRVHLSARVQPAWGSVSGYRRMCRTTGWACFVVY